MTPTSRFALLAVPLAAWICSARPAAASPGDSPQVAALAEALEDEPDYRVRIQAALSMSEVNDPAVVPHLVRALRDPERLVRAAAASSLGRVGDARALEALRAVHETDPTASEAVTHAIEVIEARLGVVRTYQPPAWTDARLYIAVGQLSDGSGAGMPGVVDLFLSSLVSRLQRISGAIVGPERVPESEIFSHLSGRRPVCGLLLTGSVTEISTTDGPSGLSVRARVSLIALDYRDQSIRTMLTGTATSQVRNTRSLISPRIDDLRRAALEQAVSVAIDSLERELPRLQPPQP